MLDQISFSRLISRCATIHQLQQIHSHLLLLHPQTTSFFLTNLLLSLSSISTPNSNSTYALSIFNLIPNPTLFAYNSIIRFTHSNPLSFYSQMLSTSTSPNHFTFTFLLNSHFPHLHTTQCLHTHVLKLGFHTDLFINNALISIYSACRVIDSAQHVFDEMPKRDIVSENSMLAGFLKCGQLDSALTMFSNMRDRNVRTWNSVISGFVRAGRCMEALDLFREMMVSGDAPDSVTVASVVSACASLGALDQGRWVHGYLRRRRLGFDVVVGTALVDMYGKCGCVERAAEVFGEMRRRDVLAWTAMISAFAVNGLGEEAFALLDKMGKCGVMPNNVTFGALLNACAHSGLVGRGRWCFDMMRQVYSVEPQVQHYACMVDLLGRAGFFGEVERLIESMPMEPDTFVWGSLLGACRMHGNVEVGERVAGYLIRLEPRNHAHYIILSDIYANGNRFEDVKRVRAFMKEHGIKKTSPGCSMIEVEGQVHEFSIKGTSKDLMKEIEWVLIGINDELKCTVDFPIEMMGDRMFGI